MNTTAVRENDTFRVETFDDDGRRASWGQAFLTKIFVNGAEVNALRVAGVGTAPEYRRLGLVREYMRRVFGFAEETESLVSLLHPFSFSFYRKFGYERAGDHRILEFPIKALDFAPFFRDMTPCADIALRKDLSTVYNRFARTRNLMSPRSAHYSYPFDRKGQKTCIWYDEMKQPAAYMIYETESRFETNRMVDGRLNVHEMGYADREGLLRLFGFMRMFEGQLDRVRLLNCAMAPEVEFMLRHYAHTSVSVVPDLMARIHDVGGLLSAVRYPQTPGRFTVRVIEPEGSSHPRAKTDGAWRVEYAFGHAQVERLDGSAPCDVVCDIPSFTQLVLGYQSFGAESACYMHGVALHGDYEDFFRAFPNRPCGVFEHF